MRILWVSNHSPFQVDFGGGQRSNLIYRTLRDLGDIDVLILAPRGTAKKPPQELYGKGDGRLEVVYPLSRGERRPWSLVRPLAPPGVDRAAHNLGRRVIDYCPNPAVAPAVERLGGLERYDLVVGRHLKNSGQAGLLRHERAIIDIDDNEIDLYRWIARDPATNPLRRLVLARRVRTLESLIPTLLHKGVHLWVTKEEDCAAPGFERARVLPNVPFALAQGNVPSPQPLAESKTILFVGMLSYIYNIQGVDWFLANVWPAVRAHVPDARFRIVGSRLNEPERARWSAVPGVDVQGFVEDVAFAYRDCRFVVAPLWSGGGTNIKILEALLHGRACVLTSAAYKGFARTLPAGESVLVSHNGEEMGRACVELLQDAARCRSMGLHGAAAVAEHYSYAAFREVVLRTVEETLKSPADWPVAAGGALAVPTSSDGVWQG